jgi:hypothetical protein
MVLIRWVSVCKWWWLRRSSTCCVILKIELELEFQHSGRGEMWSMFRVVSLPAGEISPLKIFDHVGGNFCENSLRVTRFSGISADSIGRKFRKLKQTSERDFFFFFSARHERKLVISFSASPREVGRNAECNKSSMCWFAFGIDSLKSRAAIMPGYLEWIISSWVLFIISFFITIDSPAYLITIHR